MTLHLQDPEEEPHGLGSCAKILMYVIGGWIVMLSILGLVYWTISWLVTGDLP